MKYFLFISLLGLSISANATEVSRALNECIRSSTVVVNRVQITHPELSKTPVDGSSDSSIAFVCRDDKAKALFTALNSLGGFDQGQTGYGYFEKKWSYGGVVRTVYMGTATPYPSACMQEILDANNNPSNKSWCLINLDLKSELVKHLDNEGAITTKVLPKETTSNQKKNASTGKRKATLP